MSGESKQKRTQERMQEINGANYHGTNKFLRAIEKGETGLVMAMLEQGADVHFRTQPRSRASEIVLEIPYPVESTPLHVAALQGRAKIVTLLLKQGADANARNSAGQTPLDCALLSHAYFETALAKQESRKLRLPWAFNKAAGKLAECEDAIHALLAHDARPALFSLPEKFVNRHQRLHKDVPPPPLP